jgi:hypothetical protein
VSAQIKAVYNHIAQSRHACFLAASADIVMRMPHSKSADRIPVVSRVVGDTLVELVYDSEKRKTGLVVSRFGGLWNLEQELRVGTGEILVPYSPRNNLIATGCVLLPSMPVDFGDKGDLLRDIEGFLHRYVDLSPLFERIAAHYALLTWVHDAFSELPYLRLRGDYGTGKTRALIAIGSLCYKPFFASGASTISPIFHTLDAFGATLILDEADFRFTDATNELVKILNNGNVRGLPVLRTMQNRHKEFDPRAFTVFGPKIIAMRGSFNDKALESRFLTEQTGARSLRSDIPIHLPPALKEEALALRNRLLHYRLCHYFKTKPDLSVISQRIEPRLNQTALALLSVVDDAALRAEIMDALFQDNSATIDERSQTLEANLLSVVCDALATASSPYVPIADIASSFNGRFASEYGHEFSNRWIGGTLRQKLSIQTRKSHGVYGIPLSERPKIETLAFRFGIPIDRTSPP